jgi:hydroxymethylpyrimidine pyrophosphatase-like HAD family hydrolase
MLSREEREFYETYRWALMPFRSFEDLLAKTQLLGGESIQGRAEWQKEEWMLNIYLLGCAAADIVDDFLTAGIQDWSKVEDYLPWAGKIARTIRRASEVYCKTLKTWSDKRLAKWRRDWGVFLIELGGQMASQNPLPAGYGEDLRKKWSFLLQMRFPANLKKMRMRIPAAYRSQDLAHHDVIALGEKYIQFFGTEKGDHLVVGLRTAGSYMAPLLCGFLKNAGLQDVNYITLRPKNFVHPWDEKQIRENTGKSGRFILVDEPVSTGKTILKGMELLGKFGVSRERIVILVPAHPANQEWPDETLRHMLGEATVIKLEPEEWFKEKLLDLRVIQNALLPYFQERGFQTLEVSQNQETLKINQELRKNPDKAFHVRLKKVVHANLKGKGGNPGSSVNILAKSVGWGWLGYHAALAAENLSEFVPPVYGVRNGMMYCQWVDSPTEAGGEPESQAGILNKVSDYIASRATKLRLEENPSHFISKYRESGLQAIAILLSEVFGPKVSKLKRGWVRKRLESMKCSVPALLDARMNQAEWVGGKEDRRKVDFEHHGFSKTASHNIADPAFDLAGAIFEFAIDGKRREDLLNNYIERTGDETIRQRLIYYQMLCGSDAMGDALRGINMVQHASDYPNLNRRYVRAFNTLVSDTAQYLSRFCLGEPVKEWRTPLFVMDIDDVLDKNIFGFPSTTANGVKALSLLRSHGICSIVNTARSLDEVRDYCGIYGFPGGIAEYGSVVWDGLGERMDNLVSGEAMDEIEKVRKALQEIPGVFLNPNYRFSIRAYTFGKMRTAPLPPATIGEIFARLEVHCLNAKASFIDTAITDKDVDKGKALLKLRAMKNVKEGRIGSVGDTESDFPMLSVASHGYLVNNSTAELKRKARGFGIEVMNGAFQKGLLESVICFLHPRERKACKKCEEILEELDQRKDILWKMIQIADWPRWRQWAELIDRDILEMMAN